MWGGGGGGGGGASVKRNNGKRNTENLENVLQIPQLLNIHDPSFGPAQPHIKIPSRPPPHPLKEKLRIGRRIEIWRYAMNNTGNKGNAIRKPNLLKGMEWRSRGRVEVVEAGSQGERGLDNRPL